MKFRGKVVAGKLQLYRREEFSDHVKLLEGRLVVLQLTGERKDRSLDQNRWYWGCIVKMLAEHCGYTSEEMHEALKERFLRDRINEKAGLVRIKSSAELDTKEFSEYCEQCRQLAAELGVVIPDPGEEE